MGRDLDWTMRRTIAKWTVKEMNMLGGGGGGGGDTTGEYGN